MNYNNIYIKLICYEFTTNCYYIQYRIGCAVLSISQKPYHWWKCIDVNNSIVLPIIDINGNIIASDGYTLIDYHANGSVVPKPIELDNTGEIVDLLFTNNSLFEMIFKCGLIVAYGTGELITIDIACMHIPCRVTGHIQLN